MEMANRPRRLRVSDTLRKMVRETRISPASLIYPVFICEGNNIQSEIASMEGQFNYSVDQLACIYDKMLKAGVNKILFFGLPEHKDEQGSWAYNDNGIVQKALRWTKEHYKDIYCITDVCMCEYTSHGHCGILYGEYVDNDATLAMLAKIAVSHAAAGSDMIAPSDMMDGRVRAIRKALDGAEFINTPIMSYSSKFASAFYGPFRVAAASAPAFGDRKSYQMDGHNGREALRETLIDIGEGADIVMVKPALAYLDVIKTVKENVNVPVAAYSVSGEYAMIKAASKAGFIDEDAIVCESAVSIFRAGADILISYYAAELAEFIRAGRIG